MPAKKYGNSKMAVAERAARQEQKGSRAVMPGRRLRIGPDGNLYEIKRNSKETIGPVVWGFYGWKEDFLQEFARNGNMSQAAVKANISIGYVNMCRKLTESAPGVFDEYFAEAFEQAKEMAIDSLELALVARAKEFDTTAAIFLLKGLRPERYAVKYQIQTEYSTKDGKPLQIEVRAVDYRQAVAALAPPEVIEPGEFRVLVEPEPDADPAEVFGLGNG